MTSRKKVSIIVLTSLIIIICFMLCSCANQKADNGSNVDPSDTVGMSEAQISSLEDIMNYDENPDEEYIGGNFNWTTQTFIKVLGTEEIDKGLRVFAYEVDGSFINFRGKAYRMSGGGGLLVCDIKINGDNVKLVKQYGDGMTPEEEYKMMPSDIKIIAENIEAGNWEEGSTGLYEKVEKALGVPVEKEYVLTIENGKYEIFDWPAEADDPVTIEKGKLTKDESGDEDR